MIHLLTSATNTDEVPPFFSLAAATTTKAVVTLIPTAYSIPADSIAAYDDSFSLRCHLYPICALTPRLRSDLYILIKDIRSLPSATATMLEVWK